jgi:hypothetical protein
MPDIISHQETGNQNNRHKPRHTQNLAITKYQISSTSEDMEKLET